MAMASSVTGVADPIQLFHLLETADVEVDQIKALIHEHLNETKEPSYLNNLIEFCLTTSYPRCTEVLAGLREPHDKVPKTQIRFLSTQHLFDKLNECLKGAARQQALILLSHVVYKYPSWLYKISQHSLLPSLLKLLKTSTEIQLLMGAVFVIVTLLPVIPSSVGPFLNDIFDVFTRLAAMHAKKSAGIPEVYLMHLHVAIYALFHRLYSMYPCHFLGYMRTYCSGNPPDHLHVFSDTIRPMLDYVRLHPLLVTASCEIEISKTRWKRMETHDIVVECAKLSLDVIEGTREDCAGPRLSYSCFRPIQEVCELLYPSYGFICPTSKVPAESSEDSIVGISSKMHPSAINWSPSLLCGLSTPPRSHQLSPNQCYADVCAKRVESSGAVTPSAQHSVPPSPLRIEASPFKFPPIGENVLQNVTTMRGMDDGIQQQAKTGHAPMMTTLTQVVRKLEEQKSFEREELADTEVASIIGHGPSIGSSSTPQQQLPRVVRVPSQWFSVSPYLKSLQSAQRSRSFSQGKKGQRRSAIEVTADRRMRTTKSRSLPDLRASAVASLSIDSEEAVSATRMPFTGPSPSVDGDSIAANEAAAATATSDGQPCSGYAHLLPSAFPWLPLAMPGSSGSCRTTAKTYVSSATPFFAQLSPAEILDRYMDGCRDVYSKKAAIATSGSKDASTKGKLQTDELDVLRGQVQLLHIQLMYERQKREIHAERNRRLLGKAKRAKALEEENMAMKDQMQLQEKEIAQLSWATMKLRDERRSACDKEDQELEFIRAELVEVSCARGALQAERNGIEEELSKTRLKVTELEKDIRKLAAELFNTHHDLEAIKSQVVLNETLRAEVSRLNRELLIAVELNQKCHEKMVAMQSCALFEVKLSSLREAYAVEMKGLKAVLESKEAIIESSKARVAELESMLVKKDKTIVEQKRLLKGVKEQYDEKVQAVEEKYTSRQFICQHLESEILKLHHKLETIAADKVRRRSSQTARPVGSLSVISRERIPAGPAGTESSADCGGARRKASVPIDIEAPAGVKTHRWRKEEPTSVHERRSAAAVASAADQRVQEEAVTAMAAAVESGEQRERDFWDPGPPPDEFRVEEEKLSGALEAIAAQSLASIVDFGESALEHETGDGV